jgi:signal transduction histidine kinase
MAEPRVVAKFLLREVPVRYAERIRSIEALRQWRHIPELVEVHASHVDTFQKLRNISKAMQRLEDEMFIDSVSHLRAFTEIIEQAVNDRRTVVVLLAQAMLKLREQDSETYTVAFADHFMNAFLLNRIGCIVLMTQYMSCLGGHLRATGLMDSNCDVGRICTETASAVQDVCEESTGRRPEVLVQTYSAVGTDCGAPKMAFIPRFLRYIVGEVLKNSCRATVENSPPDLDLHTRPIKIIVCADEEHVALRFTDRAGGIPFHVGSRVWSYLYSTAQRDKAPTQLAGYGVGLPMSRLYARYLGGSLDLRTWPGYGTDAYLVLPRISSKQLEVIPDQEGLAQGFSSLADHLL